LRSSDGELQAGKLFSACFHALNPWWLFPFFSKKHADFALSVSSGVEKMPVKDGAAYRRVSFLCKKAPLPGTAAAGKGA